MKSFMTILLWLVAIAVACMLGYRLLRGKNIIMGKRHPRVFHMAVFLLVVLGFGADRSMADDANDPPSNEEKDKDQNANDALKKSLPPVLKDKNVISLWRIKNAHKGMDTFFSLYEQYDSSYQTAKDGHLLDIEALRIAASVFPQSFHTLIMNNLTARKNQETPPTADPNDLIKCLDDLESAGTIYNHIVSYLWEALSSVAKEKKDQLPDLQSRLYRHARMYNALVSASFQVKPYDARGWASKAGPRPIDREAEKLAIEKILAALPQAYLKADAGLWDSEARVQLTVQSENGCTLIQSKQEKNMQQGEVIDFNRLSLIRTITAVNVKHDWIGDIVLPPNRLLSAWDLPDLLSKKNKDAISEVLEAALAGDEKAANKIERSLPLTHKSALLKVRKHSDAVGAARLRLILKLFR